MARLPILEYPDPRLRIRAEPVTKVDAELKQFVADLLETMYAAPGIGLAATQVNVHRRILVCDVSLVRERIYVSSVLSAKSSSTFIERGVKPCSWE